MVRWIGAQRRHYTMILIGRPDMLYRGGPQGAKPKVKVDVVADILAAIKERRARHERDSS